MNQKEELLKVKDLGEMAYLIHKGIEIREVITYEKKSIVLFDNEDNKSNKLIAEYYNNKYDDYYNSVRKIRSIIFNRVNNN